MSAEDPCKCGHDRELHDPVCHCGCKDYMPIDVCDICKRPLCYGGTGVAPTECYQGWRGQAEHGCKPRRTP